MRKLKLFFACLLMAVLSIGQVWGATSVTGTYKLVTSTTGIAAGDTVLLVNKAGTKALTGISTTNKKYGTLADVTVSSDIITLSSADVEELKVEAGNTSGSFSFKGTGDVSGYLNYSGSDNTLSTNATKSNNTSWTLNSYAAANGMTIANNNSTTRILRFNSDRFACYTNSTGTLVNLYKKVYAVKYDKNGGSGSAMTDSNSPYDRGSNVTVKSNTFTAPDGKTFNGWNTKANGTGTSYAAGATISSIQTEITLYAQWVSAAPAYTITAASSDNDHGTVSLDGSIIIATPAHCYEYASPAFTVSPSGKATVTQGTGEHINEFAVTNITDNVSVTINFAAKASGRTVNFDAGPVDNPTSLTEDCLGDGITLPSVTATGVCKGWTTFAGWATTAVTDSTTTSVTLYAAGTKFTPTSDGQYLYAVFSKAKSSGSGGFTLSLTYNNTTEYYIAPRSGSNGFLGATTNAADAEVFYIEDDDLYYYNGETKTYVNSNTNTTSLTFVTSDPAGWTISNTNNVWTFHSKGTGSRDLAFNYNNGSPRFSSYTGSSTYLYQYTKHDLSTTYYCSDPNCCTELGQIKGSVSLSKNGSGKLEATWPSQTTTNGWATNGIIIKIYKDGATPTLVHTSDALATTATSYTASAYTPDYCSEYYATLTAVHGDDPSFCAGNVEGGQSENNCVIGGQYTYTVTLDGMQLKSGETEATDNCDDFEAIYEVIGTNVLNLTEVSVVNAGEEGTGWEWNSTTGALFIAKEAVSGNVAISITGHAPATPSIVASPDELDFGEPKQGAPVSPQNFTLTGSNLNDSHIVTVTAPEGFLVSIGAGTPAGSLEITPSSGSVSATIIVTPVTTAAGDKSENLTISSADLASDVTVGLYMDVQETFTVNWYINGGATPAHTQTDVANTDYDAVPSDFTSFTNCSPFTFVGWSESAFGSMTSAPSLAEIGTKITANKNYYAVFAEGTPGSTTWTRVTAVNTLTAGGTFILGYEADPTNAKGTIVPMRNNDVNGATTSADGFVRSGTTSGSSTNGTITMSNLGTNGGDDYEVAISAGTVDGTIAIQLASGNYVGKPSSGNKARLYASKGAGTNMIPVIQDADKDLIRLKFNNDSSFQYNSTATNERYARYKNGQKDVIFYKKTTTAPNYTAWYTTCPAIKVVALSAADVENGSISFEVSGSPVTNVRTDQSAEDVTVDVVVASHDTGYGLSGVELSGVDGASYSNGVITIPANAEGTLTATATFAQANYTVALQQAPAAGATLTGATSAAHYNDNITLSATEIPSNYFFVNWTSSDVTITNPTSATGASFTMPDNDVTVTANFTEVHNVAWAISNTPETGTLANVYVKGIVTNIEQIQTSKYYNASYTISDLDANGEPANAYYVYRGMNVGNTNFTDVNQLTEGDEVIIFGTIKTYQGTKEFDAGNYIITNGRTAASLTSVVVSVPDASLVQTDYYSGDAFSFAGFKATAVYNTGYKKDVTSEVTWKANNADSYTVTAAGTVNVTATLGETTSANYPVTVTVTTKTLEKITLSEYAFTGYKGIALPKPTTVTAHFDDLGVKSTENVTGSAVFDEGNVYSATSTSAQTIEVKYTFGPNTATKNYTVTLSSIENTLNTAYSVTEARGIIDLDQVEGNDLDLANNLVYVEGIITAKTTNEITIKDVNDATKTMVLYKSTLGTGISSVDVNDRIKALGVLKLFNNTKYELDEGCEIVWKQPKVGITIANKALSIGNTWTIEATTDPAAAAAGLTYSIKDDGVSSTYVSLNTTTNEITALAEGSATIIAHADAYDTYAENTVEFTVTVGATANVVILAQYRGQWYAMKNAVEDSKIKAVAVDYRHGKLFDVDPADQAAITWTRTFSSDKYTFTNGENYLKGGTSTTLSLAEGASEAYQWNWNSTSGYYTTNTSATYRTFLYNGTEFKNFAVSNAKTGTGETEDYSALPVVVESEDIFVTTGYERNVTVGRMGTVCVDHNVPAGMFFGAEVYQLLFWKYGNTYEDCQMVDFEEVTEMEAGKPYLIIPTDTKFTLVYGETTVAAPVSYNGFYGTFDPIAAATDNVLVGKYGIVNNMIQKLGENCYSPANRAYIDLSETYSQADYEALHGSSPAPEMKRVSLGREGAQTPTGMENVETSEQPQKLMINGQLFILHGEKMYDATGRLVK